MSPTLHCARVCILDCLLVCLNQPLNVTDQKMPQLRVMVQTELDKNGRQFRCDVTTASLQMLSQGSRGDGQSPSMPSFRRLLLLEG